MTTQCRASRVLLLPERTRFAWLRSRPTLWKLGVGPAVLPSSRSHAAPPTSVPVQTSTMDSMGTAWLSIFAYKQTASAGSTQAFHIADKAQPERFLLGRHCFGSSWFACGAEILELEYRHRMLWLARSESNVLLYPVG
ncbi:uncharacterized protein BDV17DRAFT_234396 [Aspergillus undulatus]|uniref:uncharacterized protein n=1 Tax=Aspergillus undulatus TaxID=1810928 RepID=UPI003CCE0AF4